MANLNPRLLLQIPLLLLGSCTPVMPANNINIYTTFDGFSNRQTEPVKEQRQLKTVSAFKLNRKEDECTLALEHMADEPADIGLPDLSKINSRSSDDVNKAVVDLLVAHIGLQKKEIARLRSERKCLAAELKAR